MPRKRQVKRERNVPQVPDGDEGKDLTKEEQQRKLQTFLVDFDRKLEVKVKDIQRKIDMSMKHIDTLCQMGIQQIPKPLRKMTLRDFIVAGGTFESALAFLAMKNDANRIPMQTLKENKENSPLDNMHFDDQAFEKIASDCASILEEHRFERQGTTTSQRCPSTTKKQLVHFDDNIDGRVTQTLRTTRHNTRVNKAVKAPLSTVKKGTRMRAGARMLETPIGSQLYHKDFRTPAITPKFDPRLPNTPFDRSPRRGERLMSIDGSPVVVQTRRLKSIKKAQDRISTALRQQGLDHGALNILNDVLEILNE